MPVCIRNCTKMGFGSLKTYNYYSSAGGLRLVLRTSHCTDTRLIDILKQCMERLDLSTGLLIAPVCQNDKIENVNELWDSW